jgi:DNA repair protein RecO
LVTALSFNLLNESVIKLDMRDQSLFEFYEKYLQQILEKQIYEKILVLIVLQNFLKFSGVRLEVNHCIRCGNNKIKTISFKDHGMLCNLCFEKARDKYYELPVSKAIHYLFNEKYTMLNQYVQEIDYVIKLLYAYILDNTGVKFQSLADYETS